MDRLLSMRVFERVVAEGSFAAAARQLDLSPPVVTRLVADLETHLGTRLLQRSTRRMVLTDAGHAYLDRLRPILQAIDEAEALTHSQDRQLEGLVRIHAPPVLATYVVAPLLAEFRRRFPRIRIEIDVEAATADLYEAYDLTLIGRRSDFDADLVARKVVEARAILVASPRYLQTHGIPREPADLAKHETLMLRAAPGDPLQWTLSRDDRDEPPLQVDVKPGLCSNHSDTLVRAALDGAGITSVTGDIVASYLNDGQLVRVLEPWSSGRLAMYAVLPSRRFVPQRTRVFLEYLTKETRREVAQAGMLPGLERIPQR